MTRLIPSILAVSTLAAAVAAQTQLYIDYGSNSIDKFGYSVRTVGDVDGDQIPDFAMGSPFFDTANGLNSGQVRVYSGADGSNIYTIDGFRSGDEFGYAIDAAGDANGDGVADILITRLVKAWSFRGAAYVYSGVDGSILHEVFGKNAYDYFGVDGAGVGDVDGDGYDDFAVGAPGNDTNGVAAGQVTVFSGKTGAVIHTIDGTNAGDQFGWFIDRAGDIDGDGYADFMASSREHNGPNGLKSGRVQVFSGIDATVIHTFYGDAAGDQFGWTCSTAGDVDGDGIDDIIVGGRDHDVGIEANAGMARVFSGANGSTIYSWYGDAAGDLFGWAVRNAGDVDGDGHGDLIVGAHLSDSGSTDTGLVRIYSGATGNAIDTLHGQSANDWFGFAVGSASDVDGDGYDDVIIGATFDDGGPSTTDAGSWRVYSYGGTGTPPRAWTRGAGCPGSNGNQPRISLSGRAALGGHYTTHLRGALPDSTAILNFGVTWDLDLGAIAPECVALVLPFEPFAVSTDHNGFAEVAPVASIPVDIGLIGIELQHQWLVLDASNNTLGISASDAAVVVVGQ